MKRRRARPGTVTRGWPLLALACALHGVTTDVRAQTVELSAGLLIADKPARLSPMLSVTLGTDALGFPLLLEGSFARADFTSFGEAFHRNFGLFVLGTEWTPVEGATSIALRLGVGAVVEDDVSEDDPAFRSSNNWAGGVVPGLVLRRRLESGRELFILMSDHILGPVNALFDPEEYSVEHRLRVLLGIRF